MGRWSRIAALLLLAATACSRDGAPRREEAPTAARPKPPELDAGFPLPAPTSNVVVRARPAFTRLTTEDTILILFHFEHADGTQISDDGLVSNLRVLREPTEKTLRLTARGPSGYETPKLHGSMMPGFNYTRTWMLGVSGPSAYLASPCPYATPPRRVRRDPVHEPGEYAFRLEGTLVMEGFEIEFDTGEVTVLVEEPSARLRPLPELGAKADGEVAAHSKLLNLDDHPRLTSCTAVDQVVVLDERLRVSAWHPVYSDGAWITASELRVGDSVVDVSSGQQALSSVRRELGPFAVYDLDVSWPNTFFASGFLVHNKSILRMPSRADAWHRLWQPFGALPL